MITNVGKTDRTIRVIVGVVLIAAAFYSGLSLFENDFLKYGAVIMGLVLLATGLMSTCPAYSLFGVKTCKA